MRLKKITSLVLSGVLAFGTVLAAMPVIQNEKVAADFYYREDEQYYLTDEGFIYNIYNGGECICDYVGSENEITIPKTVKIDGVEVAQQPIGVDMRFSNRNLKVINISMDSIWFINRVDYAKNLEAINIDDSNTNLCSIDGVVYTKNKRGLERCPVNKGNVIIDNATEQIFYEAFKGNRALKSIVIPEKVKVIETGAFLNAIGLESVVMSDSVEEIGEQAFFACANLKKVTLSKNVSKWGEKAFEGCVSLREIVIPSGLKEIGLEAFNYIPELEKVYIPKSLKDMHNAFYGSNIGEIIYEGTEEEWLELCSKTTGIQPSTKVICQGSNNKVIYGNGTDEYLKEAGVKQSNGFIYKIEYGDVTICGYRGDEKVIEIPEKIEGLTVKTIKDDSIWVDRNLETIVIPKTIEKIHNFSVERHCNFTKYEVAKDNPYLCGIDGVVYSKDKKTLVACPQKKGNFTIPDGVEVIGVAAFKKNMNITKMVMPKSVKTIKESAFYTCVNLKNIEFNDTLKEIEKHAFNRCYNIEKLLIPGSLEEMGEIAFANCSRVKEVIISKGVKKIGNQSFYDCVSIDRFDIPSTVTECGLYYPAEQYSTVMYYYGTKEQFDNIVWTNKNASIQEAIYTFKTLTKPEIKTITNQSNGIKLTWKKNDEAVDIKVYRKSNDGTVKLLATLDSNATSYVDETAQINHKYTYTVKVENPCVGEHTSEGKVIRRLAVPKISSAKNESAGVKLTWGKVTGAKGYYVYRKPANGTYTQIAKITNASTTTYVDKKATGGKKYVYMVKAFAENPGVDAAASAGKTITRLASPAVTNVTNESKGIKVTWRKTAGAKGYYVYRKVAGGTWTQVAKVTNGKTTYTYTQAKAGKEYSFKVKAYGTTPSVDAITSAEKKTIRLVQPKAPALTNDINGIKVTWNKSTGAKGYHVYKKTGTGAWSKIATVTGGSISYVDTKATKGKKYYYKIAAFSGSYTSCKEGNAANIVR